MMAIFIPLPPPGEFTLKIYISEFQSYHFSPFSPLSLTIPIFGLVYNTPMAKQTLLAVLAHPDDESFGMGGTLAYYASRGAQVFLVCATRGEVGEVAPEKLEGFGSIAELRESELRCAAGILGLAGVYFLDYRDSGMPGSPDNSHPQALAAQPLEVVAAKVAGYIRQLQPDIVLTFDPIGGYRHPDHVAIHKAAVRGFELASDPSFSSDLPPYQPKGLFFHVYPKRLLRWAVRILPLFGRNPHKFGANGDIDIAAFAEVEYPVHVRINVRPVLEKKEQAGACHASQGGGSPGGGLLVFIIRRFALQEMFMRAYPPVNKKWKVSKDFYASLDGTNPTPSAS
jgi:LmbE family N-acetylglucosaminyl deacetylase